MIMTRRISKIRYKKNLSNYIKKHKINIIDIKKKRGKK